MRVLRTTRLLRLGLVILVYQAGVVRASEAILASEPEGAFVAVDGSISVSGVAPIPIDDLVPGSYRFTARGPGLPGIRGRLVFENDVLRKRSWSGPTALLFPPGITHLEHGEPRGWIFLGTTALAGGMYLKARGEVSDAEDALEQARADYAQAVSEEAIAAGREDIESATRRLADEKDLRNLWLGFAGVTWIGAAVENWFLTPQPTLTRGGAGKYSVTLPRAAPWKAALRSALFPGAGQRYMGRNGRASMLTAGIAITSAAAMLAHDSFVDAERRQTKAQSRYDRAETPREISIARISLEDAASETSDRNTIRWTLAGLAAGLYVWNILDAFREGGEHTVADREDQYQSRDLSLSMLPSSAALQTAVIWSFR